MRHVRDLVRSEKYREYYWLLSKYGRAKRGVPREIDVFDMTISVPDAQAFMWDYHEIFYKEIYKFKAKRNDPVIFDCGANIGLSALYFKQLYPNAKITAFEPDPDICGYFRKNILEKYDDVELHQKAVWNQPTTLHFNALGGDGGRIADSGDHLIEVEAIPLKDLITQPVDLLKIDVEGAELQALEGLGDKLSLVDLVFVEYHSLINQPQCLPDLLKLMEKFGFRTHICPEYCADSPFYERQVHTGMDLRLNMFFFKDQTLPN
jgi:FkbM family methyltransferase